MKNNFNKKPSFFDGQSEEQEKQKSTAEKISETLQRKKDEAFELDAAPYSELTTRGFQFWPKNGLHIVSNWSVKNTQELDESFLSFSKMTKKALDENDVAFITRRTEDGSVYIYPTLTRYDTALTVGILSEFISQSRSFYDDVRKIGETREKIKERIEAERWNKKHQNDKDFVPQLVADEANFPLAKIGQNADDLDEKFKQYLFATYSVNVVDTYRSDGGKTVYRAVTVEESVPDPNNWPQNYDGKDICKFVNNDEELWTLGKSEVVRGVETWHCENYKTHEKKDVLKYRADKFIFLNVKDFVKKYFNCTLRGAEYERVFLRIQSLGKKIVPAFSDDGGTLGTSQFFTTHTNFAHYGRDFYALLIMDTPDVFKGLETADDYLKLTENFENILQGTSDVGLRLYFDAINWRVQQRGKKTCDKVFSCQELFEKYASLSDIENRKLSKFWDKFKEAALQLLEEKVLLYVTKNGKPLTDKTKTDWTDKIAFGINLRMCERRAPKLAGGEQDASR